MIQAEKLTKKFGGFTALRELSCTIPQGCVYGLVGSNGAGKSTFLRLLAGVYRPDGGSVTLDGEPIYENPAAKRHFAFVPDELFFLPQSNMDRMALLYRSVHPDFSTERYNSLVKAFGLSPKANLATFSKGMRRQAATILALSTNPDYIFFDETFDGLDPVMRNLVKNVVYNDVCDRNCTAVLASHSLRELEDTCDQLALLHKGGILFESDVAHLKTSLFKIQVAFGEPFDRKRFEGILLLDYAQKGSVANFIVRGDREKTLETLRAMSPVLLEALPLTLEEVFVHEMDALGYAFQAPLQ